MDGSGATEYETGTQKWAYYTGIDGNNIIAGDGRNSTKGAVGGKAYQSNAGGGSVSGGSAGNANATTGGVGGSSVNLGWNAGGGGGAGGFVTIYTNTDLTNITLTDAEIYSYQSK